MLTKCTPLSLSLWGLCSIGSECYKIKVQEYTKLNGVVLCLLSTVEDKVKLKEKKARKGERWMG